MSSMKISLRPDSLEILLKILSISVADVSVNLVGRIMTGNYDQAYILFRKWRVSASVSLLSKLIL